MPCLGGLGFLAMPPYNVTWPVKAFRYPSTREATAALFRCKTRVWQTGHSSRLQLFIIGRRSWFTSALQTAKAVHSPHSSSFTAPVPGSILFLGCTGARGARVSHAFTWRIAGYLMTVSWSVMAAPPDHGTTFDFYTSRTVHHKRHKCQTLIDRSTVQEKKPKLFYGCMQTLSL